MLFLKVYFSRPLAAINPKTGCQNRFSVHGDRFYLENKSIATVALTFSLFFIHLSEGRYTNRHTATDIKRLSCYKTALIGKHERNSLSDILRQTDTFDGNRVDNRFCAR